MAIPPLSLGKRIKDGSISVDDRSSAMASSWIKRLCPNGVPNQSRPTPIPLHLKSCFPFPSNSVYKPNPHHQEIVQSSETKAGFGPFQVRVQYSPSAGASSFFSYRHQLTKGILGNFRPLSQLPVVCTFDQCTGTRDGSASRSLSGCQSAEGSNFYTPYAFSHNTTQHLHKRQNYCFSSEPEESFSYWDMGTLDRKDFVSSVYPPATSSITIPSRKRMANTYGFIRSKFRRFDGEG